MTLSQKKKQTITVFGAQLPRWKDCPKCKKKLACQFFSYTYETQCSECLAKEHDEENKKREKAGLPKIGEGGSIYFKQHKDVTGIGVDKRTGETVGIGTDGKSVPLEQTRYKNLRNDPYGWRATGKKVKGYQRGKV